MEVLSLVAVLILGLTIGIQIGMRIVYSRQTDGVLNLYERDDTLLVGVAFETTAEKLELKKKATFDIRKVA